MHEYTLQDWMSGKPEPTPPPPVITWTYGLQRSKRGRPQPFWTRSQLSGAVVIISHTVEAPYDDSSEPKRLAQALLSEFKEEVKPTSVRVKPKNGGQLTKKKASQENSPSTTGFGPGAVCVHCDNEGHHMSLIVNVAGENAYALFLSTNPSWSKHARLARPEEAVLLGQFSQKQMWLVPVVRPLNEFYCHRGTLEYPTAVSYCHEFAKAFRSTK